MSTTDSGSTSSPTHGIAGWYWPMRDNSGLAAAHATLALYCQELGSLPGHWAGAFEQLLLRKAYEAWGAAIKMGVIPE